MFFKTLMIFGFLALAWSATWFYRLYAGTLHLNQTDILPMIVGGVAGGIGSWYLVPRLMKREAQRRQAAR